jgi:glycosyltransferase involved in cell wall biosynthesis
MSLSVSIITVCFNAAASITSTLDSVRFQTWKPLESIVIDGGSTDGTQECVAHFKDITSSVVSESDMGTYDAMNKGINLAHGDIIHFLNAADSFVDESVVEVAVSIFITEPDVDLVFGNVIYRSKGGSFMSQYHRINASNLLYGGLCHQGIFARRRLFEKFGLFNLEYRINADFDWLLRVFRGGAQVRYIDRPIANYDTGGQSNANLIFTRAERKRVQLQYTTQFSYQFGRFVYQLRRKLFTLIGKNDFVPYED